MDGREIISTYTKNKMSIRPEFFAGRGATTSDLNSELLELIYGGVKKEFGDEAAANFVQFVYDQDKLAATLFLNAFYFEFVGNNCKWTPRTVEHNLVDELDCGPDNGNRLATGMAAIAGVLGGQVNRDQTEQIRGDFLWRHKEEYKPDPKREKACDNMWS